MPGRELLQPTLQQLSLAVYSVCKTPGHPCSEGLLLTFLAGCAGYAYQERLPGKPNTSGMPFSYIASSKEPLTTLQKVEDATRFHTHLRTVRQPGDSMETSTN